MDHGEAEALRLIGIVGGFLGLPDKEDDLEKLRKGDGRKALLATVLRKRTTVGMKWISERLVMGHPGSVSRLIGGIGKDRVIAKRLEEIEEMLNSGD